jgi:hypothetical protein
MEWQTLHRYAGKHCLLALRHVNDHAVSLLPRRYAKKMLFHSMEQHFQYVIIYQALM